MLQFLGVLIGACMFPSRCSLLLHFCLRSEEVEDTLTLEKEQGWEFLIAFSTFPCHRRQWEKSNQAIFSA